MTRACGSCQWWVESADPDLKGLGRCKGGPPTTSKSGLGDWPVTGIAEWCGAFRLAERMAGGISDADFEAAGKRMAERLAAVGKGTPQ